MAKKMLPSALIFDLFGTCLDWRSSIIADARRLYPPDLPPVDWAAFADAWSVRYGKAMRWSVENTGLWWPLDLLLATAFFKLAEDERFRLDAGWLASVDSQELSAAWSRLRPWPDTLAALPRLASRFRLAAFSNANTEMAEQLVWETSQLPFDLILSAEDVRRYKPDPAVYRMAIDRLGAAGIPPDRIMLIAAHTFDLNAAHQQGIRTALVARDGEPGSDPAGLDHEAEVVGVDLVEVAGKLMETTPTNGE